MKKLTKSEAAKKLGVSRPTIYRLIRKGTLVPDENGLLALADDQSETECNEGNQPLQDVTSVLMSSEKLKDKYIASLEAQVEHFKQAYQYEYRRSHELNNRADLLSFQLHLAKMLLCMFLRYGDSETLAKIKDEVADEIDPVEITAREILEEVEQEMAGRFLGELKMKLKH